MLQAEYTYGPFGELIQANGYAAASNPWRYATKYQDEETGLYYFGRRYLDPVTGQWLSREPLGESESVNLYSYCGNDPINKVDVLGFEERVIAGSDPVLFQNPEKADSVYMAFPLEEDGWFSPFAPNGKYSFVSTSMPVKAARQYLEHPELVNQLRDAAGGYLDVTHAHAQIFYIDNSLGFVGGIGEMSAGIAAASESAGVSLVATIHGFDVTNTHWQRLWAGPQSDIQSGTSLMLQMIPGIDRSKAEAGDALISFATSVATMRVMGKAPLVYNRGQASILGSFLWQREKLLQSAKCCITTPTKPGILVSRVQNHSILHERHSVRMTSAMETANTSLTLSPARKHPPISWSRSIASARKFVPHQPCEQASGCGGSLGSSSHEGTIGLQQHSCDIRVLERAGVPQDVIARQAWQANIR